MKNVVKVSKNEMIQIFMNVTKSTFVNLVTEVVVKMNKTGNPYYGKVIKKNRGNYLIGNEYEQRIRESFEVQTNWFEHVSKCVVQSKKNPDQKYLQYEYFKESNPVTEFSFEGQTIDKVLFEDFLVKKSEPNQPLERKVYFQTYSMDSIKEFSLDGTKYIIEN